MVWECLHVYIHGHSTEWTDMWIGHHCACIKVLSIHTHTHTLVHMHARTHTQTHMLTHRVIPFEDHKPIGLKVNNANAACMLACVCACMCAYVSPYMCTSACLDTYSPNHAPSKFTIRSMHVVRWNVLMISQHTNSAVHQEIEMTVTCKIEPRNVSVTSQSSDGLGAESTQSLVQAIHLPTRASQVILVRHWSSNFHVDFLQKDGKN